MPTRRTVAVPVGGGWLFGKWRLGERARAAAEWRWLHVLPLLGVRASQPVAWIVQGRRSLLVTAGLPGRAVDAWAADAIAEGWLGELAAWACARVAPVVRALHDAGLVYRDLYWNHIFANDPRDPRADAPPSFVDVERVFAPGWRFRRWVVKDLAGLLASAPAALPVRAALRFLRAYLGTSLRPHRRLMRAIVAKAGRIRSRLPRYG
ncbi:MAG: lipopolysaccharide kinase InaA family protein [Planctomycetota bacterium]